MYAIIIIIFAHYLYKMKKMKKSNILIIFIFSILFIGQLSAQKRICGTMDYLEFSKSKDSSLDQRMRNRI